MRVLTAHIAHSSRSDVIKIKPFFDMHLGSKSCDENKIDSDIAEVLSDPNAYAILGGDACFSLDTEVLTERGFVGPDSLSLSDKVLGYEMGTEALVWQPIERIINKDHEG